MDHTLVVLVELVATLIPMRRGWTKYVKFVVFISESELRQIVNLISLTFQQEYQVQIEDEAFCCTVAQHTSPYKEVRTSYISMLPALKMRLEGR